MKDKFQEAMAKNISLKIQMSDMRAKHTSCLHRLKTLMEAEYACAQTDHETEILARHLKIIESKKIIEKIGLHAFLDVFDRFWMFFERFRSINY